MSPSWSEFMGGGVWSQHTGLDDVYPDVVEAGVDLLPQERRRHRVDVVDAQGVLGRQRRGGRHGVAPMGGDDLLVRLEAPGEVSHVSVSESWPDRTRVTRDGFPGSEVVVMA